MERNSGTELARVRRAWARGLRDAESAGGAAGVPIGRAAEYLRWLDEAGGDLTEARRLIAGSWGPA